MKMKIGVLALQGAFREHRWMLEKLGVEVVEIRKAEELGEIDGLIIPGGESTTIGKLLNDFKIMELLQEKMAKGFPVYGTCAGMILLCDEILGSEQPRIGGIDAKVRRNAYGRQLESFEADFLVKEMGDKPFRAVFIRAPYIESVGEKVDVMAVVQDHIVVAKQGNLLVSAFHPELTEDSRIHEYFLQMVKENKK
jgi:pyridoxal 5''-phosphate synthase, glutaminase subunit Pdx2